MRVPRLVGSPVVRWLTLAAAAVVVAMWILPSDDAPRGRVAVTIVGALTVWVGAVYSFRAVFERWSRAAEALQKVMVAVFFGAVYLLIVPPFGLLARMLDPLGMRRGRQGSQWVERPEETEGAARFDRLG